MEDSFNDSAGQALVEYLLVLIFAVFISLKLVSSFSGFFSGNVGGLGDMLTKNLMTGVCPTECFFSSYRNSGNN